MWQPPCNLGIENNECGCSHYLQGRSAGCCRRAIALQMHSIQFSQCVCVGVLLSKSCVCVCFDAKDSLPAQYPNLSQDRVSGFYIFREFTACSFLPNLANVSLTLAGRRLRSSRQVCCCVKIWTSVCSSMWASKPSLSLSLSGSRLSLCLLSITPFRIQSV